MGLQYPILEARDPALDALDAPVLRRALDPTPGATARARTRFLSHVAADGRVDYPGEAPRLTPSLQPLP
jgi:hypothetical protein